MYSGSRTEATRRQRRHRNRAFKKSREGGATSIVTGRQTNVIASGEQYRHTKAVLPGRRPGQGVFRQDSLPYTISRFQGLNTFDTYLKTSTQVQNSDGVYGLYAAVINSHPYTSDPGKLFNTFWQQSPALSTTLRMAVDATTIAMPMFAFNLSVPPVGVVSQGTIPRTSGVSVPMFQLLKVTLKFTHVPTSGTALPFKNCSFWCWHPVKGQQNSHLGATTDKEGLLRESVLDKNSVDSVYPQFVSPRLEEQHQSVNVAHDQYTHMWSDIRLCVYGAARRPTSTKVSLVHFNDDYIHPSRVWKPFTGVYPTYATGDDDKVEVDTLKFRDQGDTFVNGAENITHGLCRGYQGAFSSESAIECETGNSHVNAFWESYWSNRIGHPLTFTVLPSAHKKMWNTVYSKSIVTPPIYDQSAVEDHNVVQHVHQIFKKTGTLFNTDVDVPFDNQTAIYTKPSDVVGGVGTSLMTTGYFSESDQLTSSLNPAGSNSHIFGDNAKRDLYLIVEGETPLQTFFEGSGSGPLGWGPDYSSRNGSLPDKQACFTPPIHPAEGLTNNPMNAASFDIMVRSRYNFPAQ